MTAYTTPLIKFTPDAVREAREKRRQVLAAVRQRRRESYLQFMKKRRLQAGNNLAIIV